MVGSPNRDRKAERREATRREILAAAWDVAHESGLISVTLREIAARIGMRPPSLYSHFASKNAIFDAMFAQAWDEFGAVLEKAAPAFPTEPRERLLAGATTYFDFAVSDLARHQLMDMPMLPDFTPSPEAFQSSLRCYGLMQSLMSELGIDRQPDLDLYTALIGGLVNQQLANDPGGDRWRALLPRTVTLFADDLGLPPSSSTPSLPAPDGERRGSHGT
jgi:AcrR family transcriptional regulator